MSSEPPHSADLFLASWPEFAPGGQVDELRTREFARLDADGHVYLDYTGAGLPAASQLHRHLDLLLGRVLGNPHSQNPTSQLATELVDRARRHVLSFFNASPDDYLVVFTANASHALKLVGESYPFGPDRRLVLTFDNHNSVNGIREYARAAGAEITYIPVLPPDLRVEAAKVTAALEQGARPGPGLFAFPAQSNFSGVQHDLSWIAEAQSRGWDVLLDAAAFVPTNRLDLSRWRPDFAVLSFYKMFGYPTGVGALIARRTALGKLRRPWFAGGTITVASVGADQHQLAAGAAAFEDGTLNFASLPAVDFGLDFLEQVGVDVVHRRVRALTGWLLESAGVAPSFHGQAARHPLRSARQRGARRHDHAQFPRRPGPVHRPPVDRAASGRATHFDSLGLFLQPWGRRACHGPLARRNEELLHSALRPDHLRRLPAVYRRKEHRGRAPLARPGQHLRRCPRVRGVCEYVSGVTRS